MAPAHRMEVTVVAVTPDVKLLRPAVIMDLQVNTPGDIITHCVTSVRRAHRWVLGTFTL